MVALVEAQKGRGGPGGPTAPDPPEVKGGGGGITENSEKPKMRKLKRGRVRSLSDSAKSAVRLRRFALVAYLSLNLQTWP